MILDAAGPRNAAKQGSYWSDLALLQRFLTSGQAISYKSKPASLYSGPKHKSEL